MIDLREAAERASGRVRSTLDRTRGGGRAREEAAIRHPSHFGSAIAHRAARVRRAFEHHLRREGTDPELAERLAEAEVVVDDRIKARRDMVEQERRNERRREVVALIGGVLLGAVLIAVVVFTPLLHVRDVEVRGTSRMPPGAVLEAAALDPSDMVLEVDTDSVASSVESLPWVRTATVRRHFPWRVTIDVDERSAVGRQTTGETIAILDSQGRVLDTVAIADAVPIAVGLPEITGTQPVPPVGGFWHDRSAKRALVAAGRLGPDVLGRLRTLAMVEGTLVGTVTDTLSVGFGPPDDGDMAGGDMERKGRVALAVLADLERRQVSDGFVDVTVPAAPAFRPGLPAAAAQPAPASNGAGAQDAPEPGR